MLDLSKVAVIVAYSMEDLLAQIFPNDAEMAQEFRWSLEWQYDCDASSTNWFNNDMVQDWFIDHGLANYADETEPLITAIEELEDWEILYACMYSAVDEAFMDTFGDGYDIALF